MSQVRVAPPFSSRIMKQPLAEVKVRLPGLHVAVHVEVYVLRGQPLRATRTLFR
jgi:hypothetical protein